MFQLSQAIEQWCNSLNFKGEDREPLIEELKDHLYREIKKQRVLGLSEEEAFKVATEKLGDPNLLEAEFQKVQNGRSIGKVIKGLSSDAIQLSESGDTVRLESSLQVPFKTLLLVMVVITLVAGVSLAVYVAEPNLTILFQVVFSVIAMAYILFEHRHGRTFLEIKPDTIRQQFRIGPFTLSDNIYANEHISNLEAKRMMPGFDFGVCRVQFRYGTRIRAFNVGYYNDEADYIIRRICETVPRLKVSESAIATTTARSSLSKLSFAILALIPIPVFWRLDIAAQRVRAYYEQRPLEEVPAPTELLLGMQAYLPWILGYASLCSIPLFLLLMGQIKQLNLVKRLERLLVMNGLLTTVVALSVAVLVIWPG